MLKNQLIKILTNKAFYFATASIVILLLFGTIYISPMLGEKYALINFIFSSEKDVLVNESQLCAFYITIEDIDSYLNMFLPIITSIPFVILICEEKKNNITRYEIYRTSKKKYIACNFFAVMLIGGLVTLIGYLLFCIIAFLVLPNNISVLTNMKLELLKSNSFLARKMYNLLGIYGILFLKCFREFLYGAFMVIPAFTLSKIIKNRYVITSFPFMFFFLLRKFIEKGNYHNSYYFLPSSIGSVYINKPLILFCIYGGTVLILYVLCNICIYRKCDCGED